MAANWILVPTLQSITPSAADEGTTDVTIALIGSNFVPDSIVSFNGNRLSSSFSGQGNMNAVIPASDLLIPGSYTITVINPDTVGAVSNAVTFTVNGSVSNPVPSITSLSPNSLAAGAAPQTLTINGTGFLASSTVTFNGITHSPTYESASQLTISLTSTDLATSGTYPMVVTNPAPGGGASTAALFTVTPAGSEPGLVRVTNDSSTDNYPAWSPTSALIAFASAPGGQDSDIWEVSPSGTNLQRLTTGTYGSYGGGITYPRLAWVDR